MPGMIEKVRDPLLRRTVSQVERTLDPKTRASYDSTVAASMQLLWSKRWDQERENYLNLIQGPEDIPKIIAKGIVKVISIVHNEAKLKEPIGAAVPAGIVLAAQVLEYVEKRNKIDITPEIVDQTTVLIKEGIFALYGITQEKYEQIVAQMKANGGKLPAAQGAQPPPTGTPATPVKQPPTPPTPQPPQPGV